MLVRKLVTLPRIFIQYDPRSAEILVIITETLPMIFLGWQNLYLLSHPLAPQAKQARASGENLKHATLASQARQAGRIGEILNYSLSR